MRLGDLAALVIHVKPYRETSALVQFFTRQEGRFTAVMRGVHRQRRGAAVQPFYYGVLSCYGRSNLMTVTQWELTGRYDLAGDALSAGFYVLELITRCLGEKQSEPAVFDATQTVLLGLQEEQPLAPLLRNFELDLLADLGYAIDYRHDAQSGAAIEPDKRYQFLPEGGFVETQSHQQCYQGEVLLAIGARRFSDPLTLRTAKQVNQAALAPLLGSAPLISRALYTGRQGG